MPPGFTQEVPLHLMDPDVPKDPLTGVPILDFENFCCGKRTSHLHTQAPLLLANLARPTSTGAHGFSALIVRL